jgi:hypothetical protein
MGTVEALAIVEARRIGSGPKEDDWDLFAAALALAVQVRLLMGQNEAFQAALDGGPDPRKG